MYISRPHNPLPAVNNVQGVEACRQAWSAGGGKSRALDDVRPPSRRLARKVAAAAKRQTKTRHSSGESVDEKDGDFSVSNSILPFPSQSPFPAPSPFTPFPPLGREGGGSEVPLYAHNHPVCSLALQSPAPAALPMVSTPTHCQPPADCWLDDLRCLPQEGASSLESLGSDSEL